MLLSLSLAIFIVAYTHPMVPGSNARTREDAPKNWYGFRLEFVCCVGGCVPRKMMSLIYL